MVSLKYSWLVGYYRRLEATSSKLELAHIVAEALGKCDGNDIGKIALLLKGTVFPSWGAEEIGIAHNLMIKALADATGRKEEDVEKSLSKTGDLGTTAEELFKKKLQMTLGREELTVDKVWDTLRKLPSVSGHGSQDKKLGRIEELLNFAKGDEVKYLVRTILGVLRLGVADGIIRDGLAEAFEADPKEVQDAFMLINDYGEVAEKLKEFGKAGLRKIKMKPGIPIDVMRAQKLSNVKEAFEKIEGDIAFEIKYDGMRTQIHKDGDKVWVFTRRQEDVTKQFPEVAEWMLKNLKAKSAIIEGETVAIRPDGKPMPFQMLSRRIKRKYGIEDMAKVIPVEVNLFDIIYWDKENMITTPFGKRWGILKDMLKETKRFKMSEQLVTSDMKEAEEMYARALKIGHEGVMAKNLKASYQPGLRVGHMYKIKPVMESLDLVITGAEWGEGKRAKCMGSFLLSCYDNASDEFLEIGRLGSGFTDEQLEDITKTLKDSIVSEKGGEITLRPSIVVEVGYEEIQKSPSYSSGFALRFPRLLRIRDDRATRDADTIERVGKLYETQKGHTNKDADTD